MWPFSRRAPAEVEPERQRGSLTFSEYLQMVEWSYNGNTYFGMASSMPNRRTEIAAEDFGAYVQAIYRRNGVVAACIHARALVFSEVRFRWRNLETKQLFGTPALSLLETPNLNVTTGEMLTRMEQDVSLAGNWFAARRHGRLWRLRPDWVDIILASETLPEDPGFAWDAQPVGYMFHPGGRGTMQPELFPAREVAHWSPIPDPLLHCRGVSWLSSVLPEVSGDMSATEHKLAFFDNAATPNLVFVAPESVTTAENFERFREAIDSDSAGARNHGKNLFLAAGASVVPVGSSLQQMDFKSVQGAGETRIAAAARVPASVLGISEGLAGSSLNAGNYGMARRQFGDGFLRPQWRSACAALSPLVAVPAGAELWYDASDVAFLHEDSKDAAEILSIQAQAIRQLIDGGFDPASVVDAVDRGDLSQLKHTGNLSVQLQPPGQLPAADKEVVADAA